MAVAEAKKPSSGPKNPKSPRAYPSFYEMASNAIVTLKERTGSSQYAIAKFLEEKHQKQLPSNFKKLLLIQLKRFVASGKLVKVKNSYKLPPARSSSTPSAQPAPVKKPASKVAAKAAKPRADTKVVKPKRKATTEAKGKPAAKVAKTSGKASPGAKKVVVAKPKKVAVAKAVRKPKPKPKSVKSPAKKKVTPKKANKGRN